MDARSPRSQMSEAQRTALSDLVHADPDLLQAKFHVDFSRKDSEARWKKIAAKLNAIPGANKDWRHWRKTWQDLRCRVKNPKARLSTEDSIKIESIFPEENSEDLLPKEELSFDDGDSDVSYKPPARPKNRLEKGEDVGENRLTMNVLERELNMKSSYYERKLQLMERQVIALEKMANAVIALDKLQQT